MRGLGARRSTEEKKARFRPIHHLLGAEPLVFPPMASLEPHATPVMDQGAGPRGTSSCTGHGGTGAACTTLKARGHALPFECGSQRGLYADARLEEGQNPLVDQGATIADVIAAMSKFGIRAMGNRPDADRYSDVSPENVNALPTQGEDEESRQHLLLGAYVIDPQAPNVADAICAAIGAKACCVLIGADVDARFESFGETPQGDRAIDGGVDTTTGGGHCMFILGYRTNADGSRDFRLRNSWGAWNGDGSVWVTERWLRAALWEAYALDVTPAQPAASP